ncbi:MAG TPA: hypothetical protein VFS41_06175 [Edaphobacter sp.]|nr:hypothetical protein [Edaphobacter sp.]
MRLPFGRLCAAVVGIVVLLFCCRASSGQAGRFDLTGPRIDVRVTRGDKTLPIASVPNLQPGDKLWLFADLPRTQSVHYLLVAVFLRGTTNPPPDKWFYKIETWNKKVREEGVTITIPDEAQQAILFLAPETGGDFSTLKSAVQGRPGIFVRASQDLTEAGFEQARIEKYLASIRAVPPGDPKALKEHSELLARTLNLHPNQDCFNRPMDQQYACLTQSGSQTLLNDGHGETVVSMLSRSDTSALIGAAANTSLAGGGIYSAYVGAVVDLVRLTSNLHTAQYQYIPAIAFPQDEALNLRLNTAPSFHNPKSVIVIGLPSIQKAVPPPLRASDAQYVTCMLKPGVTLPVEGAPLVFSTAFAHDMVLHINGEAARQDIPLVPDPFKGGLVLSPEQNRQHVPLPDEGFTRTAAQGNTESATNTTPHKKPTDPDAPQTDVTGTITGYWGFDPFTGPTLPLQDSPGTEWKLATDSVLIAGRENHLTLSSSGTACIESITFERASGKVDEAQWKRSDKPNVVDVTLSLKSVDPGNIHLDVHQYGGAPVASVRAQTFSEPARIFGITLHAGDTAARIQGTSLNQVRQVAINNLTFTPIGEPVAAPDQTGPNQHTENLTVSLPESSQTPALHPGDHLTVHVALRDGRTLSHIVTVDSPRPSITLLNRAISKQDVSYIRLANPDDLPVNEKITFSLHSASPFPRNGKIEVANVDESLRTDLTVASGLILQNSHTLLGSFDPLRTFGTSAYGPIRLRPVAADGTVGDWISLANLVRLPRLQEIHCPSDPAALCTLSGSDLYLIDSISNDASFSNPVTVPEGFVGNTLSIPRPPKSGFYLKLRDEPDSENMVVMPVQIQRPPAPAPQPIAPPAATPTPATPAEPSPTPTTPDINQPAPSSGTTPDTMSPSTPSPATPKPVRKPR